MTMITISILFLNSNMSSSSFLQGDLTSFRKAVATNNKESIEKHLSHMKNLSEAELNQALFISIENFRIDEQTDECLFLLLRNKANPNCVINGQTPLIAACKIAQITLVKNLIENGAKPDLCSSDGRHPLEFVINSRKQNYDVAEYLISVMSSVNIEIGKDSALVVTVEKEFLRIFKMLVEKGAALMLNNEQSILHVIVKRKFKDQSKKKRFLKELSNRLQLSQVKDKHGKLPLEYELDNEIKNYYQEIFKPKIKSIPEKDHHLKFKDKEIQSPHQVSKDKESRKKHKEEEQPVVNEEEGVQEYDNEEEPFPAHINEELKEKIVELIEEEEEEKKIEQEKDKNKKTTSKILTPNVFLNTKKLPKHTPKGLNEKQIVPEKSSIADKDKGKKIIADKKKKQPQPSQKKNKSFTNLTKKNEIEDQKKEDDAKKKSSRKSSQREEDSKKINRKQSEIKLQKYDLKAEEGTTKIQEVVKPDEQPEDSDQSELKLISPSQIEQVQHLLGCMVEAVCGTLTKVEERLKLILQMESQSDEQDNVIQSSNSLQDNLRLQIIEYLMVQEQQYKKREPCIHQIINYLQNKMKLCLESHIEHAFNLKIAVYGSQATALCIGQSDLDLLVITSQNPAQLIKMFESYQIFIQQEIAEVKFIKGASMPVIKLVMGEIFCHYKVDITFQIRQHTGLRCAQLIEEFKAAEPLLKPLVIVLKQIIYAYSLADPYTGGLGSYSLTLMVIALLQFTQISKKQQNLGRLFMQFLLFYGFNIDYVCQAIIIHPPILGFDYKPFYSIYQLPNTMDLNPKLVIYDPINPVNNVGRTTYRIAALKNLFKVIYIRLKADNLRIADILRPQFTDLIQQAY